VVHLPGAGQKRHRQIFIAPKLKAVLEDSKGEGKLFDRNPFKALKSALIQLGIYEEGKVCHAFRHYVGTQLSQSGTPIRDVQAILGHQDVTTTMRYVHENETRQRRAMSSIDPDEDSNVIYAEERFCHG
jgi:integrase